MILLSVNKPHTDNIFRLFIKSVEWRKKPLPKGRCLVYETKRGGGCGMVIGEVEVYDYREYKTIAGIPAIIEKLGAVDRSFLKEYAGGKPLYANFFRNVIVYDEPKPLAEFKCNCPKWKKGGTTVECGGCDLYYADTERLVIGCFAGGKVAIVHPPQSWCRVEGAHD